MANTSSNIENGLRRETKSQYDQGNARMESECGSNGQSEQESLQEMANSKSDGLLPRNGGLCNGDGNGLLSSEEGNGSEVRSKAIGRSGLRGEEETMADSSSKGLQRSEQHEALDRETETPRSIAESFKNDGSQWAVEPRVGRVADGIPNRVDRLKGLGNAIVPQVIHQIGVAIAKEHNK